MRNRAALNDNPLTFGERIKVWDPLVRVFHWTLVATFFLTYFTEDALLTVHVWAGYVLLAVVGLRILWGFVGARRARFSDFVTRPAVAVQYLKDTMMLRAPRFLGHNPAGGLLIVLMLVSLILTGCSGMLLYGADEHAGPFAFWFGANSEFWEEILEEVHEGLANFTLFLVFIHIAGVAVESIIHDENLSRAMWDGYKRKE